MKKMIAVLCAMTMLFSLTAVLAEATENTIEIGQQVQDFDITMKLPEGYISEQIFEEGNMIVYVYNEKEPESNTSFYITVAYSEEYDEETVSELTEEEKAQFIEYMGMDMNNPVFSQDVTDYGTAVFFLKDEVDDPELSYAIGLSVYEGYIVNMYVLPGEGKILSEDDIALGLKILSELWFTAVQ